MQGHTNRTTINQRRPLTENMRYYLGRMAEWGLYGEASLSQAGKNAMRALFTRGYVSWDIETRAYSITDAGRSALSPHDRKAGQ